MKIAPAISPRFQRRLDIAAGTAALLIGLGCLLAGCATAPCDFQCQTREIVRAQWNNGPLQAGS